MRHLLFYIDGVFRELGVRFRLSLRRREAFGCRDWHPEASETPFRYNMLQRDCQLLCIYIYICIICIDITC